MHGPRPRAHAYGSSVLAALACACVTVQALESRTFASTPRAVSELKRGWADAVFGDYPVMAYIARESMGTLEVVREQFEPEPFGIAAKKGERDLVAAMTAALRRLMHDGAYMEILRTWAIHIGKVEPPPAPATTPAVSDVAALKDGKLSVGMELKFAPMEFRDELGRPTGADVDLSHALGKALGVEVEIVELEFDALLPALSAGKIDVVISAMTITAERQAQATFIPYLLAGSGILVKSGNPLAIRRPRNLCGKKVALQEGTAQVEMLESIACE